MSPEHNHLNSLMIDERAWPAHYIEKRSVESLVPYARNARTHDDKQVDQIAASIREWGWTAPVLVDEKDTIIAGHGRVLAAKKLGIAEIPVMVARGWTDAQKQAYCIADNQISLKAGWDESLLKVEISDLLDAEFDATLLGFSSAELKSLTGADEVEKSDKPKPAGQFGVIVICESAEQQAAIYDDLQTQGFNCRVVTT